jgi:MOSC domain-containing protein YiiM
MTAAESNTISGRVASLHLRPEEPGAPLLAVDAIELIEGAGIMGDLRYFKRLSRKTGQPARRQVSLIEREQVSEHAASLGMEMIPPGAVRSNVETFGIDLVKLVGSDVAIGTAVVRFYEPRDPCSKMDAICQGLRERMLHSRQGVMAEVVKSGNVRVGDSIRPVA